MSFPPTLAEAALFLAAVTLSAWTWRRRTRERRHSEDVRRRMEELAIRGQPAGNKAGFTLIELVVALSIIGILASVAVPALLGTLDRARQARTMAEIRTAGAAWTSWRLDQEGAASAGGHRTAWGDGLEAVDPEVLAGALEPFYLAELPRRDAWGHPLAFARGVDPWSPAGLMICAGGSDGPPAACPPPDLEPGSFAAADTAEDIIWADGSFLRWPGGQAAFTKPKGDGGPAHLPPPENPWL